MERAGLINKVKIKLDEYTPEGVSLPFDDYIGPMLDESANEILEKAPLHLLTATALVLTGTLFAGTTYPKSYIPVPADFIRLAEVKYPLWKKSVRKAISTESPEYSIQENEYLAGGYGRPSVVILFTAPNGGSVLKYLECSKVVASATPTTASYIKTAKPEELNDLLADALSWLCASKIFAIGKQGDMAKMAIEQFANSLTQL